MRYLKLKIKSTLIKFDIVKKLLFRKYENRSKRLKFSERELIFLFHKYFISRGFLLDVGAHYGESFNPYEKIGWDVVAFEPDPSNRKKITVINDATRLYDYAISNVDDEELTLYVSDISTGISSLAAFHESHKPSVTVKVKTLRKVCEELNINRVDYLKIDTEGFDLFVLKGFPFEIMKPQLILCEFEDGKTTGLGYSYEEMGDFLLSQGYAVYISEWYPIEKYGIEHSWKSISKYPENKQSNPKAWGNFIAVRKDAENHFSLVLKTYLKSLS